MNLEIKIFNILWKFKNPCLGKISFQQFSKVKLLYNEFEFLYINISRSNFSSLKIFFLKIY